MSKPIIRRDITQHSPEWYAIKAGKWSASNAATIMGGLDTSGLASLIKDIAWERVFGPTGGGFQSPAMERGNELEADARAWFEREHDATVEQVGCVLHATIPHVLWSPDGLYDNGRRAVEIKCPLHKAWMEVCRTGKIPAEYRWQTKWGLWVGRLDGEEFVAYHPDAGGLIVECEVSPLDCEQMEERVALLEPKVAKWIEIIGNRRASLRSEPEDIDLVGVTY